MIIWGYREKRIKQAPFPRHRCQICFAQDSYVIVYGSYFHLFWIPLFPVKKSLKIICGHCENGATPKSVSEEVRQFAKQLKSSVRLPIWMYSGSFLIVLTVVLGLFNSSENEQKIHEFLSAPEVKDIYYFYIPEELSEYKYEIKKVMNVEGDSVDIAPSAYRYKTRARKLLPDDGFHDVRIRYHKNQLIELHNKGMIRGVKRGYLPNSGFNRNIPSASKPPQ